MATTPCPLLDSAGGIWQFKTNRLNQQIKDAVHYGIGFKNVVGLDWNSKTNSLFMLQHGRDQLHDLYPQYYSEEQAKCFQPRRCMKCIKAPMVAGLMFITITFNTKNIVA